MKELFIIRGLPGSGKSTLGSLIAAENCFSADDYFTSPDGTYNYNPSNIGLAHKACLHQVFSAMTRHVEKIAVCNTFTKEREFEDYVKYAYRFKYRVHYITLENRHNSKSHHNVPDDVIKRMKERFEIKL